MRFTLRSLVSRCLVLPGFFLIGIVPAAAQVLEVCTVKPVQAGCDERSGTAACTAQQLAADRQWMFSCSAAGNKKTPKERKKGDADRQSDLNKPFYLPTLASVKWCGTTINPAVQSVPLDMPTLLTRILSSDYTLASSGNYVVIVSRTPPATGTTLKAPGMDLDDFNETIKLLLETVPANPGSFSVELVIPHAGAFGSTLASQIGSLNSPYTVKATGRDRMSVSTTTGVPPNCDDWKAFLVDLRELVWSIHPESAEGRLTASDASAMATALGVGGSTAPAATTAPAAAAQPAPAPATPATTAAPAPALTITVTPPPAAGAKPAAGSPGTATTITVAPAPAATPAASTPAASTSAPATAAVAGAATPGVSVGSIEPDLLVFSDTSPGDDALITEKKRVAAILDLPRPEMTISAWVMQNSSTDPRSVTFSSQNVREEVQTYNKGIERTILQGWQYLQNAMSTPSYFDPPFYNYIARRVIFDGKRSIPSASNTSSIQQQAHNLLNEESALSEDITATPENADHTPQAYLGACDQTSYCLGFTTLFHPIKPRLTDLMLALIAAHDPQQQVNCAVNHAEGADSPKFRCSNTAGEYPPIPSEVCKAAENTIPCEIWIELKMTPKTRKPSLPLSDPRIYEAENCEEKDYLGVVQSMLIFTGRTKEARPVMFLNCFRETASKLFETGTKDGDLVTQIGLLRASIADFLFNYKISQQYPHEFVAYDLTTSAQAMNTALRPLVDAFVRDVTAYQVVLKRRLGLQIEDMDKHLTAGSVFDKARFFNNALVTVTTIANSEAITDTSVESYLEAANPPTLSGLAGALSGATGATGTSTTATTSALNQAVGATRFNEAQLIAAGLTQFQSSRIHIGRELSVDVKPESLLGANSAELQVVLKADDEATSGLYSSGTTSGADAEVSRFGKNDTTTRIRVDSLKLFEVSSFASQLMAPKKRFPLLPVPGLEMPYFGSILSAPLKPAREFHTSMAVLSAIVIPTAADLAFSARFVSDRLLAPENAAWSAAGDVTKACLWPTDLKEPASEKRPPCRTRPMVSLRDFNGQPVREFNRMMTQCLATGGVSATPNLLAAEDRGKGICQTLNYRDVLGDVQ
jgi:hypothetical protein